MGAHKRKMPRQKKKKSDDKERDRKQENKSIFYLRI